jgi:hypothetical protein
MEIFKARLLEKHSLLNIGEIYEIQKNVNENGIILISVGNLSFCYDNECSMSDNWEFLEVASPYEIMWNEMKAFVGFHHYFGNKMKELENKYI